MIMVSTVFDVPVEQLDKPLRRYGTRWFTVRSTKNTGELLEWAVMLNVPMKFFQGDRFRLPEAMRDGAQKYGVEA